MKFSQQRILVIYTVAKQPLGGSGSAPGAAGCKGGQNEASKCTHQAKIKKVEQENDLQRSSYNTLKKLRG